jgi:hypothetical protein
VIRYEDWHARLGTHIKAALKRPFSRGEFDCCTFACDGILAMTGVDPMAELRGRYNTGIGAARAMKTFAGGGLDETAEHIAGLLHAPEIPVLTAGRGDCVLADVDDGSGVRSAALGLVGLSGRAGLFAGPSGLTEIPLRNCRRAWRV